MDNESCTGTPEPTQCSWFDQALSSGVDFNNDTDPDYQNDYSQDQDQNQEGDN